MKNIFSKKFISVITALLLLLAGKIDSQTLNLNHFGIEDGLPQSSIYTMVQDNQGNLWFGTMSGISKYNGLVFENFSRKDSLAENRVTSSVIDTYGNIWFGHLTGGITRYLPGTKKFSKIPSGIQSNTIINCILSDSKGNLWFGTNANGIYLYEPKDSLNGTFKHIQKKDGGLSSNRIISIIQDKSGAVYAATPEGVNIINGDKYEYLNVSNGLPSNLTTALLIDSRGNLWIGTEDKGVYKIKVGSSEGKNYTVEEGLSNNNVRVLFEDANHTVFIGTNGGGVCKYLAALEENHYAGPLFQIISTDQGLSNDRVLSMMQDREKNIWIGTVLNLNQYFDEQFEIYGENEGLKNSLIWSIIQDKKGTFWIGTEGGLVEFKQDPNEQKSTFTNHTTLSAGATMHATALYEDAKGNIWFTYFANGVSVMDPVTKKITTYTTKDGLAGNDVFSINGDKKGNIWIATNGGGVCVYNVMTRKFETINSGKSLNDKKIYTIYRDSRDNLWFGTIGGELTMYDGSQFKKFGEKEGYNNQFTLAITEDAKGNMWFGSYDKGIFMYDGKTFKNYSSKDGLASDQTLLLTCDNKNNLWIGSNLGIDKFNFSDQIFKHYGKQDGFLGIEINPNSVCKDKDGNLWFGSVIGVVKYAAKNEKNNLVEPIVYLKDPRLFFNTAEIPEDHSFSYFQNHFTFDFVGASLTNPKRVLYKYMLDGVDDDWSPAKKENYATYPSLAPGTYTFKVIAANNDGVWNKEPKTFTFTIRPPFWKTWWFISLCTIVVIAAIFLVVKQRELKLRKQNEILEQKVDERTEELRKEKEVVEAKNVEISKQNDAINKQNAEITKQNSEINKQKAELEKKNQNIKDSIDYAQRIQEAVFVPIKSINELFPENFILFRPKDIVSGDFYWAAKKDGKLLFAVADCTGHGVPGAFMSIIGSNLLNNIVKDSPVTQPSKILDELSIKITETLNANTDGRQVKDGMDMALCCYDPKTNMLEYAGAHNAMYHIRGGTLTEYKSDKFPIGKTAYHDETFKFNNYSVKIEKGDEIVLFTDGYADSIGGPKRTKFFYPPFRKMLTDNSQLPMEKQKENLDTTIKEWLGEREQIDDIAIMGVRF